MTELIAGGSGVVAAGLRFRAQGFDGVVEETHDVAVRPDRGGDRAAPATRGARLLAALAAAPEGAFEVEPAAARVAVSGTAAPMRGVETPVLDTEVETRPGYLPILLAEDEDGFLSWELPLNHEQLRDAGASRTRDAAPLVAKFAIPMEQSTAPDDGTRGVIGFAAKKLFRVVSAVLFDELLEEGGKRLAKWMERDRPHRLRSFGPDDYQSSGGRLLDGAELTKIGGAGRALLFIHGTNNLSHGAFHGLPQTYMRELWDRYEGRVLAFDHPTLSVDPVKNARWLAENIPAGLDLHVDVISHSRGGLVARELVERGGKHGLGGRLIVESVAFVGTPNRGTPLCQPEHLAKYVDALTNMLSAIPDNGITDAIDAIVGALSHVARKMYEGIPGVMAMDPKGTYLVGLNKLDAEAHPRSFGISVDFEPTNRSGWQRRLRDLLFDQVFTRAPNDLVVPTKSVWNDDRLSQRLELKRDSGVDHSTYWENDDVRAGLTQWLQAGDGVRSETAVQASPAAATQTAARAVDRRAEPDIALDDDDSEAVAVEVVHGSLEHARYPVCIGHFRGAALEGGAEGYLDRRLGGTLSRRQVLGLYPEQEGYVMEILPGADNQPPGAVVVCLGSAEEFSARKLVRFVTQAALAVLAREIEARESGKLPRAAVGLSTVLIGTSRPVGLSVPACVMAVLEGVSRANHHVASLSISPDTDAHALSTITRLELLERDEDRAEIAARTLLRDPTQVERLGFRAEKTIRVGEGGRTARASADDRSLSWRTLQISQIDTTEEPRPGAPIKLQYTLVGSRAGAPVAEHVVDKVLVDSILGDALQRRDSDEQIRNTVFELLVPRDTKLELSTGGPLTLVVDDEFANYPWEMLASRGESDVAGRPQPLCVQSGFLRRLRTPPPPRRRGPAGRRALVIGNPPVGSQVAPLAGARDEAVAVASVLADAGYKVTRCIFDVDGTPVLNPASDDDAYDSFQDTTLDQDRFWTRIVHELFRNEYRIVHIAAHGHFDADRPERSGAVIGRDAFLSSAVFGNLPIGPDFVFFNCCHLGQIDSTHHGEIAASVAKTLMRDGVRAVVAAGWAVDDREARAFAQGFYEQMLGGSPFGEAVRVARKNIYDEDRPSTSTWGAYQCYGDPGFRIAQAQSLERPDVLVLENDGERRLLDLAARAGDALRHTDLRLQRKKVAESVAKVWKEACERGWNGAGLLVAHSKACAAVGAWKDAVDSLRTLLELPNGDYSLADVEQLANYEVRLAQSVFRAAGRETDEVTELFESAERRLAWLLLLKETAERLALEASYHKKRATTCSDEPRRQQMQKALECYVRAERLARTSYHSLNRIQMETLLRLPPTDGLVGFDQLEDPAASGDTAPNGALMLADYWARVARADRLLTRLMIDGKLAAASDELRAEHDHIFGERSTWKERDSTIGHIWDLSQLVDDDAEKVALHTLWDALSDKWQRDT